MATVMMCDTCLKVISDEEIRERGLFKKTHYCADCVRHVDDYLAARDALHTRLAGEWDKGVATLRMAYKQAATGGVLPDE